MGNEQTNTCEIRKFFFGGEAMGKLPVGLFSFDEKKPAKGFFYPSHENDLGFVEGRERAGKG